MFVYREAAMRKKLDTLNTLSAIPFFISSVSLWIIPFLDTDDGLPAAGIIAALLFWTGLLSGAVIQTGLFLKCRKLNFRRKTHRPRLPLALAGVSFVMLVLLVIFRSRTTFVVVGALFCTLVFLQAAVIIKRKECLK